MHKWRPWIALILIAALSWIELQFISESAPDSLVSSTRKILHIVFFLAVMLIGYFGWYTHPVKWLKKLWLVSYSFVIFALLAIGIIGSRIHLNQGFLDQTYDLRVFFISPVPFLILLVFSKMKGLTTHN